MCFWQSGSKAVATVGLPFNAIMYSVNIGTLLFLQLHLTCKIKYLQILRDLFIYNNIYNNRHSIITIFIHSQLLFPCTERHTFITIHKSECHTF